MVGAAVVEVEVPAGTSMAGFAAREAPSEGAGASVSVRALVIADTCWITVDVCGLHEATCRAIIGRSTFAAARVVVSATHTHAGPCVMPGSLGECDAEVLAAIVGAATRASRLATTRRERCSVHYEAFADVGVARNRRHPTVDVDPELQAIVFKRGDDSVLAWFVQYPCHPVVLGADNHEISGDYPTFLRQYLEAQAPGSIALFVTGAAGDVNTGHSAESSFSQTGSPARTMAEAERIGAALGRRAQAARNSAARPEPRVRMATDPVVLEFEALDSKSPLELAALWAAQMPRAAPGEQALLRVWSNWARTQPEDAATTWNGTVTVLRLGDLLLIALPGEPFLGCAELIQAQFDVPVVVVGYSNGCPGYFPTAVEYSYGGYEVLDAHRYYGMPAPFKRGSAEKLAETAIRMGRQLS